MNFCNRRFFLGTCSSTNVYTNIFVKGEIFEYFFCWPFEIHSHFLLTYYGLVSNLVFNFMGSRSDTFVDCTSEMQENTVDNRKISDMKEVNVVNVRITDVQLKFNLNIVIVFLQSFSICQGFKMWEFFQNGCFWHTISLFLISELERCENYWHDFSFIYYWQSSIKEVQCWIQPTKCLI